MCGCTGARCHWIKDLKNRCSSCGGSEDTAMHITHCTNQGREDVWKKSVDDLDRWMRKNNTKPHLRTMISSYLWEREDRSMTEIAASTPQCLPPYYSKKRLRFLGEVQDRLGWDCMVEGQLPSLFVQHQHTHLAHTTTRMTAKQWARGLIQKLFQMTHKHWLLRNAKVHIKCKGDLTQEEHDKLLRKIEKLLWTDHENLLPDDCHLLEEEFGALGKASALDQ